MGQRLVPGPYFSNPPQLVNDALHLQSSDPIGEPVTNNNTFVSGYYDHLGGIHCLYLHSNLCNFNTVGPRQTDADVIARLPVEAGFSEWNTYRSYGLVSDFNPAYNVSLNELQFRLTDAKGNTVPLHGGDVSVEILLGDHPSDLLSK